MDNLDEVFFMCFTGNLNVICFTQYLVVGYIRTKLGNKDPNCIYIAVRLDFVGSTYYKGPWAKYNGIW